MGNWMKESGLKPIGLYLPETEHQRVRIAAAFLDVPMSDFARDAVRKLLMETEEIMEGRHRVARKLKTTRLG